MVTLTPVVEVLPPETSNRWPVADLAGHVPLSGRLKADEIGALLHALAVDNLTPEGWDDGVSPAQIADELLSLDRLVALGGLQVYDSATGLTISPSCCSGLEDWREWGALPQGYWPFLGHDPSPWIEILSDRFRVWPDDGRSAGDLFIDIPARELPGLLRGVQRDLLGFLNAVEKWALAIFPDRTPALLELLDECFDIRSALNDSAG